MQSDITDEYNRRYLKAKRILAAHLDGSATWEPVISPYTGKQIGITLKRDSEGGGCYITSLFTCSCPDRINSGLPFCKHQIMARLLQEHEAKQLDQKLDQHPAAK